MILFLRFCSMSDPFNFDFLVSALNSLFRDDDSMLPTIIKLPELSPCSPFFKTLFFIFKAFFSSFNSSRRILFSSERVNSFKYGLLVTIEVLPTCFPRFFLFLDFLYVTSGIGTISAGKVMLDAFNSSGTTLSVE